MKPRGMHADGAWQLQRQRKLVTRTENLRRVANCGHDDVIREEVHVIPAAKLESKSVVEASQASRKLAGNQRPCQGKRLVREVRGQHRTFSTLGRTVCHGLEWICGYSRDERV